jgi:hypothetical protein
MNKTVAGAAVLLLGMPLLLGGCGDKTLDKASVEKQIATILNDQYRKIGHQVDSVSCDITDTKPDTGVKFPCVAKVSGAEVNVEATVKDSDRNVDIAVQDKLYDLPGLAHSLSEWATTEAGRKFTVDCGTGVRAAVPGDSFDCGATGSAGKSARVIVTVGQPGADDSYVLLRR